MKFIPILFSTPMVKSLLNGKKFVTRRKLKSEHCLYMLNINNCLPSYIAGLDFCPYGKIGDGLWVRETVAPLTKGYAYRADDGIIPEAKIWKWKPSIFMPKDACRLFLEVTEIKVERLQDISEEDSMLEGVEYIQSSLPTWKDYLRPKNLYMSAYSSFKSLWISINEEESWNENPWVWVIKFKIIDKPENFII